MKIRNQKQKIVTAFCLLLTLVSCVSKEEKSKYSLESIVIVNEAINDSVNVLCKGYSYANETQWFEGDDYYKKYPRYRLVFNNYEDTLEYIGYAQPDKKTLIKGDTAYLIYDKSGVYFFSNTSNTDVAIKSYIKSQKLFNFLDIVVYVFCIILPSGFILLCVKIFGD